MPNLRLMVGFVHLVLVWRAVHVCGGVKMGIDSAYVGDWKYSKNNRNWYFAAALFGTAFLLLSLSIYSTYDKINKRVVITQVKNGVSTKYETKHGGLRVGKNIVQFTDTNGKIIILSQGDFVIEYPDGY